MLTSTFVTISALAGSAFGAAVCDAATRLKISQQIPYAYAQNGVGATQQAFANIPFGVGSLAGPCPTFIYPNGGTGIPVAVTGNGVVTFGTTTRQVFSKVTGNYVDFPANGTTVIYTDVTLGVRSDLPIPVTFAGQVYLDFTADCRISAVRAYAEIPTEINGQPTDIYKLLGLPNIPLPI